MMDWDERIRSTSDGRGETGRLCCCTCGAGRCTIWLVTCLSEVGEVAEEEETEEAEAVGAEKLNWNLCEGAPCWS